MTNLTDLEICKRIAEIEGCIDIHENNGNIWHKKDYETLKYNPLTDDALCFQFCHQDDIYVSYTECPAGSGKAYWAVKDGMQTDYCDTPNRAVCMAKLGVFSND